MQMMTMMQLIFTNWSENGSSKSFKKKSIEDINRVYMGSLKAMTISSEWLDLTLVLERLKTHGGPKTHRKSYEKWHVLGLL